MLVDIGATATPIVTGLGLVFAGRQLRGSRTVAKSEFMLNLDRRFQDFIGVQMFVSQPSWEPENDDDGYELARFMALLERIAQLVDDQILDLVTVNKTYGWRMQWLLANDNARNRLYNHPEAWEDLIHLWQQLDWLRAQERGRGPLAPGHAPPGDR